VKRVSDFSEFAQRSGEWMRGTGPESDIVISSRIRLARNLADFPFIRRCSDEDRVSISIDQPHLPNARAHENLGGYRSQRATAQDRDPRSSQTLLSLVSNGRELNLTSVAVGLGIIWHVGSSPVTTIAAPQKLVSLLRTRS
jgi:hypothetical protein